VCSLFSTVYAARATVGAFHTLHKQEVLTENRDIRAIQPWMTIPYVAHIYHVPASYLYSTLGIKNKHEFHDTIFTLAAHHKRSSTLVIHELQTAILTYHKQHPYRPLHPTPAPIRAKSAGGIPL